MLRNDLLKPTANENVIPSLQFHSLCVGRLDSLFCFELAAGYVWKPKSWTWTWVSRWLAVCLIPSHGVGPCSVQPAELKPGQVRGLGKANEHTNVTVTDQEPLCSETGMLPLAVLTHGIHSFHMKAENGHSYPPSIYNWNPFMIIQCPHIPSTLVTAFMQTSKNTTIKQACLILKATSTQFFLLLELLDCTYSLKTVSRFSSPAGPSREAFLSTEPSLWSPSLTQSATRALHHIPA